MSVKEVLNRAADLMQQHGHAKMRFIVTSLGEAQYGKVGSMCLQGALQAAMGAVAVGAGNSIGHSFDTRQPVYRTAMASLAETILAMEDLPDDWCVSGEAVPRWNNFYATEEQAIAALRATAERVEA